jgi:hypothetical protein
MSKEKPWATKGPVGGLRVRKPSRRHLIDVAAAELIADLMEAFVVEYRHGRSVDAQQSVTYELLRKACYGLAFVTADGNHKGIPLQEIIKEPRRIAAVEFPELRRIIHTLWRAENWNSQVIDSGDNPVSRSVQSGTLLAISQRLRELIELATSQNRTSSS